METKKTLHEVLRESFDFEGLSEEEQNTLEERMQALILENVLLRAFEGKEQEEVFNEFKELMESSPSASAPLDFLEARVPQFMTLLFEEVQLLKENA